MLPRLSAYWFHTKWLVRLLSGALDIWYFRQSVTYTACNQLLCLWLADVFMLLVSPSAHKPTGLKLADPPHIQNLNPFIEYFSYCHSVDLIQDWKLAQCFLPWLDSLLPLMLFFLFLPPLLFAPSALVASLLPAAPSMHYCTSTKNKP